MSDLQDGAVEAYWGQLRANADEWVERTEIEEHTVAIAGRPVTLRFAGPALVPVILPALQHLAVPPAPLADLTVLIGDGASTGMQPPPLPWPVIPDQAWMLQTTRFSALHLPALGSILWFDREERVALYWMPDASASPLVERGSPLLTLWAWWLADRGLQLTHAAAIGGQRGAALIAAPSGSGKSTTALACVGGSLRYLADDYCVVEPSATPVVHSIYCSGKVAINDGLRFPTLRQYRVGEDDLKTLYLFHPSEVDLLAVQLPLSAILVPVVTARPDSTLAPISAMSAVRAAAPSTVLQLRTGPTPADALQRLADVARRVPCYRLELGTELDRIPHTLSRLLD